MLRRPLIPTLRQLCHPARAICRPGPGIRVCLSGLLLPVLLLSSCFQEIDTEPLPLPELEETFITNYSIKAYQQYYQFHEVFTTEEFYNRNTDWDLCFESAGSGSRVMLGWASFSTGLPTGFYDLGDLTKDYFSEMIDSLAAGPFDDPTFINEPDSLALTGSWESGEVWLHNRGTSEDNYYAIQFVSADEASYTFRYVSARALDQVYEKTIYRVPEYNYVYYSYALHRAISMEPDRSLWDILFTPYRGWWETDTPGEYAPFNMSGIMINNESGIRIAHVFDPDVSFGEISLEDVAAYEFMDKKGAVGADWKVLGDPESGNIFTMDPDKKYLMRKPVSTDSGEEVHYYKLRMISYRNDRAEDHYPTVEFVFLGIE